jgi:hypothetical protein
MNKDKIVSIAMICHQANKAYCHSIGDHTQKDWDYAEQWQRDSAIKGVEFRLNNPLAGDDAQHNAWMQEKVDQGWVYGPEKDAERKEHPCLVPFGSLPLDQQIKDKLFCAIVDAHIVRATVPFGDAVKAALNGKAIMRIGWNASGMFAYIVPANAFPAQTEVAKRYFGDKLVPYRPYWALKTAQGDIETWAPSGSDSLADDWIIFD